MAVTDQALAWTQLFGDLDRSGLALHFQIRRAIVTAIERGLFTAQARLPSTRQLATLLGVARNTVVNAYQQLIDEGFLVAHERSGIFLAPDLAVSQAPAAPGGRTIDWSERLALRPARLRQ